MTEIIICCGLMGCGKTTFAKEIAEKLDYNYIDFDHEYHFKIQQEHIINPPEDIKKLLETLSEIINNNKYKNYIIDNWFKWHKNWWKDEEDNTLQKLQKKLKYHDIKVFNINIPFKKAYEGYMKKNKPEDLIRLENYKDTMKERYKNLNRKIYQWAIQ